MRKFSGIGKSVSFLRDGKELTGIIVATSKKSQTYNVLVNSALYTIECCEVLDKSPDYFGKSILRVGFAENGGLFCNYKKGVV